MDNILSTTLEKNIKECETLHKFFKNEVPEYFKKVEEAIAKKELCCDFLFGNPQDYPEENYIRPIQKALEPKDPQWFGYKASISDTQELVANWLNKERNTKYTEDDILMTSGNFNALYNILKTVVSPGDEVIYNVPSWFFYKSMIVSIGAVPIVLSIDKKTFSLDLPLIEKSITSKTKAIIINSPHNPTGMIYQIDEIKKLSEILLRKSKENGRPIYLLSDEAYFKILFDDNKAYSPTEYYPHSFLLYTFGKQLLAPGNRMGFIAYSNLMDEKEKQILKEGLRITSYLTYSFPSNIFQYSLNETIDLSIDLKSLEKRRDKIHDALVEIGYECPIKPMSTFYLMVKIPIDDNVRFIEDLKKDNVWVLNGATCEMPGYFRICFTSNEKMIETSIPIFRKVFESYKK